MFVTLNHRLMKQNMNDLEWIYVHELAHIICQRLYPRERGHGRTWKFINTVLGFEPSRTHALNTEGLKAKRTKYNYRCNCRIHSVGATIHKRISSGARYTCKDCKFALTKPSDEVNSKTPKMIAGFEDNNVIGR
jgi:SprT protein